MLSSNKGLIQFIKFAVVGIVNTGVDWLVFFLLTKIEWFGADKIHESGAKGLAFMVAVSNSYIWNRIWTFQGQSKNITREYLIFFLVSLGGLIINTAAFYLTRQYIFKFDNLTDKIIPLICASTSGTFWNFFASRNLVFKSKIKDQRDGNP